MRRLSLDRLLLAPHPRVRTGILLLASVAGCFTVPSGAGLGPGQPASASLSRAAWLERISIQDPEITNRDTVEESLTLATLQYVGEAGYFARVNHLPGKVREDDVILRLEIDRYRQKRSVHPAYFPGALLTLTFYIWFGGPIVRDSVDLSGTLRVEDARGVELASVSERVEERHSVSFWSSEYALPSGLEGRTEFVKRLFDRALTELAARASAPSGYGAPRAPMQGS